MRTSARDWAIYTMLGRKLRGAGLNQLLAAWPDTAAGRLNGKRWVAEQERIGLLETFSVQGRPVKDVELIYESGPGIPPPHFTELSRESCRRWDIAPVPLVVVRGTKRLGHIVGGSHRMRFRALDQIGHDLGVSSIYLRLLRDNPGVLDRWVVEDDISDPTYKEAKADAVILNEDGVIVHAIEFASGYSSDKFAKIDRTFRPRGITYSVWMRAES